LAGALVAALPCIPSTVHAQGADEAGAHALFDEGRNLVKAGHYPEACAKFEAARRLFVSSGLLLNLADCHERVNRTATAWAEFADAAFTAANTGRTRDEAEAKRRHAALESKLTKLLVHVNAAATDEVIRRDGVAIANAAWGSAIPIDPGTYAIAAEAPGRITWSQSIDVHEPGKTVTVEVPALAQAPVEVARSSAAATPSNVATPVSAPESALREAPARSPRGSTQRLVGIIVGSAGLAGMAAGGVLAILAKVEFDKAQNETTNRHHDSVDAGVRADAATYALAIGGAFTAAGVLTWVLAPRASVTVGLQGTGITVSGHF
jgi:hypothetical protein